MIREVIMNACRIPAFLAAFLFILTGCSKTTPVRHEPDRGQAVPLIHHIDKVEMNRLPDALAATTMPHADKEFITANVHAKIYGFVTVKMYLKDGHQILEIDEFNYDEWVHSVTGERGKSPHGTHAIFKKVDNDWNMGTVTHYGG